MKIKLIFKSITRIIDKEPKNKYFTMLTLSCIYMVVSIILTVEGWKGKTLGEQGEGDSQWSNNFHNLDQYSSLEQTYA